MTTTSTSVSCRGWKWRPPCAPSRRPRGAAPGRRPRGTASSRPWPRRGIDTVLSWIRSSTLASGAAASEPRAPSAAPSAPRAAASASTRHRLPSLPCHRLRTICRSLLLPTTPLEIGSAARSRWRSWTRTELVFPLIIVIEAVFVYPSQFSSSLSSSTRVHGVLDLVAWSLALYV